MKKRVALPLLNSKVLSHNEIFARDFSLFFPCFYVIVSICQDLLRNLRVEPKGPFNYLARDEAGIPREWYERDDR